VRTKNLLLWAIQILLALLFLFAGGVKLVMTADQMTGPGPIQLPALFIRFIGVCEVLGAIGLILPGLTGIQQGLTPLAAAGLVVIMIGATIVNLINGPTAAAIITVVAGGLAVIVVRGRRQGLPAAR
jgi:uncharacterized membrane protein YphA (DoxX/SURF4 family)